MCQVTGSERSAAAFARAGAAVVLTDGVRRVVLDVAAFNARAIRLYRRLGLNETGRQTETFDRYGAVEFIDMERLDVAEPG